jgi:hypothetical protein
MSDALERSSYTYTPNRTSEPHIRWWVFLCFVLSLFSFFIHSYIGYDTLLFLTPWLISGLIGGIRLSKKKMKGKKKTWIWMGLIFTLGIIPIIPYLAYLTIMMLLGEIANYWSKKAEPAMKKCPRCMEWVAYKARGCKHCGVSF